MAACTRTLLALCLFCLLVSRTKAQNDPCPKLNCFACLNQKDQYGFNQPVCGYCVSNGTCLNLAVASFYTCIYGDNSTAWAQDTSDCGSLSASELRIIIIVGSLVGGILAIGGCYYYWASRKKEERDRKVRREEGREDRRRENVAAEIHAQMRRASVEAHVRKNSHGGDAEFKAGQPVASVQSVHQAEWHCSACTYKNEGPSKICKMCGTVRPSQPEAKHGHARAPSHGGNQQPAGGHNRSPSQGNQHLQAAPGHRPKQPSQGGAAPSVRPSLAHNNQSPEGVVFVPVQPEPTPVPRTNPNPGEGEGAVFVPI